MSTPRLPARLSVRLPHKRTVLKALHWSLLPFFVWFIFADPGVIRRWGPRWFQLHSLMGLGFCVIALAWTAVSLRNGLLSRPGPKLPGWGKSFHRLSHLALVWSLFLVAFGGFLLGLTASFQMKAGGFLPFAPPLRLPRAHDLIGTAHSYQFYSMIALVAGHAAFHIWRHVRLRDNALKIMAPK
ncbi:MAG: cytochrome b/b6 domain-containing protein, partial [Pseudomonadota bacterium]